MGGLQNNVHGFTDILGTFELYFAKHLIQKTVDETNRYAQQYKNSRGNIFSRYLKVRAAVCESRRNI
jgi:hypothetical protein